MCVFASNVQVQLLPESKIFIWIKRNTGNLTGQAYTTLIVTHNFYFTLISFLFSNNNDNPMTLFMSYTVICVTYFCIAWTMPSQDVCPSVCLSVTHRYYVLTAKHILKFFSPSPEHCSFPIPNAMAILGRGTSFAVRRMQGS